MSQEKLIKTVVIDPQSNIIDSCNLLSLTTLSEISKKHKFVIEEDHFRYHGVTPDAILSYFKEKNIDFDANLIFNEYAAAYTNQKQNINGENCVSALKDFSKEYDIVFTSNFPSSFLNSIKEKLTDCNARLLLSSDDVKEQSPSPAMLMRVSMETKTFPSYNMAKIVTSYSEIQECANMGCWSIAVCEGSGLLNKTPEQLSSLSENSQQQLLREIENNLYKMKPDFVVLRYSEIKETIKKINSYFLKHGQRPGHCCYTGQALYQLYTPGPITTSVRVKIPMFTDIGSRENDYLDQVQRIRAKIVNYSLCQSEPGKFNSKYTSIIIQGSGTFGVESALGSIVPHENALLLVICNGLYGERMLKICDCLDIKYKALMFDHLEIPDINKIEETLKNTPEITHVAYIHSETTTGILNPIEKINPVIKKYNKITIIDAMSSFGAVPIDMEKSEIDFLVSSANKNLEGLPGFAFIIAKTSELEKCKNIKRRSLSLNCYDQWDYLEKTKGGFRFTSPVHCIRALDEAMIELDEEGGVAARYQRYSSMQKRLTEGMIKLGFKVIDLKGYQGPIITTFLEPKDETFSFDKFYDLLKDYRCVIYNGKLTNIKTFRIGSIGFMSLQDIDKILDIVQKVMYWDNTK